MEDFNFHIRLANPDDIQEVALLFYNTIQNVNIKDYSKEAVDEWSSTYKDYTKWTKRLKEQYFIVAVFNRIIVGFGSLAKDGYLDLMYVHKDFQRKGFAKKLFAGLEKKAVEQKNDIIYSDVSITAKAFFLNIGFELEQKQIKKLNDKELINFRMLKRIRL